MKYTEFVQQKKAEVLKIKVTKDEPFPSSFFIDNVNGKTVEPLALTTGETKTADGTAEAVCEIKIKPLAKHFQKGINRFEVAYDDQGQRIGTEVILDIQM